MCEYVSKKDLREPRETFNDWVNDVHREIRENYKMTFQTYPIGSGSNNLVINRCDNKFFDLDFQIVIEKFGDLRKNDCKKIKQAFIDAFNNNKPQGFTNCEDSTQSLTTKNRSKEYGYDIIITYSDNNDFYIIHNNKNKNGNNNNDYEWQKQSDLYEFRDRLDRIEGPEMWEDLRKRYKKKRHGNLNNKNKKSYQMLNEAAVETLKKYGKKF